MPTIAELFDQAIQCHQRGDLALAENLYGEILKADPHHADAWHLLGVVAEQAGRHETALEYIGRALRLRPDHAEAHGNLGYFLWKQGKLQDAEACCRRAIQIRPGYAEAINNLGNVLRDQGNLEQAEACYRQALRLRPSYAEAHNNLGNVLRDQGRLEEAEAFCRQALRLTPDHPDAHNSLGNVFFQQGKLAEAEVSYRQALRYRPSYADARNNLGNIFFEQGKLEEAAACYREALRLDPNYPEAHLNLGMYWLVQGQFARGWPEYEWRRLVRDNRGQDMPAPGWDGSSLNGRTILLQAQEGIGDAFQFVRYARHLKSLGGRVALQCQPALAKILADCPGIDQIVTEGTPPAFHVSAPLLSLPLLCRTTLDTIPAQVPYLRAEPERCAGWRSRLAAPPGFKVGICWQGNPRFRQDQTRSAPLAAFAPLASVPGVRLIALQRGHGLEQIAQERERLPVLDLPGRSEDPAEGWLDTAALIQALDLVVSIDSAVAHLAGALAAPVWVALPFMAEWRWLLSREDSPWYPTMRLFRQRTPGDWPEVFQRINVELAALRR